MNGRQSVILMFVILVAAWLQASISNHIAIWNGRPDFVLVTLVCMSILVGSVNGALFNVWGGFLTAVLAGVNYGSILVSRLITGSLAGLLRQHVIENSIIVPPAALFLSSWICEGIYFVMAPNLHSVHWWLRMVFSESLYNAALSVPIYFGLKLIRFKDATENSLNPFFEKI